MLVSSTSSSKELTKGVVLSSSGRSQVRRQERKRKKRDILGKLEEKNVYFCKRQILHAHFNSSTVDPADECHIVLSVVTYLKVTHLRARSQTIFHKDLEQLSQNLAVNQGSTKTRHS